MFIYIFVPILLTLLAVSFPKMGPRSKSLSISLTTLLLFVIVAFRGRYVDHDYRLAYEYFIDHIPDAEYMFRDFSGYLHSLPAPELSFCVLASLVKSCTCYVMPVIAFLYAMFAVPIKMKGIRRLTNDDVFGFALLFYFSNLFLLHEMTQIRAGLAVGLFMCAIPAIHRRQFARYVLFIAIASLIHRSAMMALPLYFLGTKSINLKLWVGLAVAMFVLALVHYDVVSIILNYNVPVLHHKLVIYSATQDWLKFEMNLFNVFIFLQFFVALFLYWKRELVAPHCPYFYFALKLNFLSIIVFYFFSRIPVFAFRLSDFLGCATIILYPLVYYVLKPRFAGQFLAIGMAWCILLVNLFHNKLVDSYYMIFFE